MRVNIHQTPEFRLLCLAARRPQSAEDAETLCGAIAAGPDWRAVVEAAQRHRLVPLVFASLQNCGSGLVPPEFIAELRRQTMGDVARSLAQIAEIDRLLRAMAFAGIRVLVLKGVALSAQIYGDPGLRSARDIDLLVAPEKFSDADRVLVDAGYQCHSTTRSPRQMARYLRWVKDLQYIHNGTGACVELHNRLTDNPNLLACDFDTLWAERVQVPLGESAVATLPARFLPLYLCVHGAIHGWERLRWLADLAAVLRQPGAQDTALEEAEAAGLRPLMLHAMVLAHDLFGLKIKERDLAQAASCRQVRRLDRILAHFFAGSALLRAPLRHSWKERWRTSWWLRRYRFALKSDWRYWRSEMVRDWLSPVDWETIRLPDALFWLYPIIRPVGWLLRRRR